MADKGMIRGYSIKKQLEYVRSEHFTAASRDKILAQLPAPLQGDVSHLDPAGWYPREDSATIYRAIVSSCATEEDARKTMVGLGEFIGEESTNTFLKLVMRLMTPVRFANKLPSLWERDMRGGYFTADVSGADAQQVTIALEDVGGYDHIGPVTEGWITFGMRSVGAPNVKVVMSGWSLATPGPERVSFAVSW